MLKAEDFRVDGREIFGWRVSITSYKIGGTYYCHIDNVDPGATVCRSEGPTHEDAVQAALLKAQERLANRKRPE